MYIALPLDHPLADSDELSMSDFADAPWLSALPGACPDAELLDRACHGGRFRADIVFQNDDYSILLGFVAAGVGVALIPDMAARTVRDDVVVRPLTPPPPSRTILAAFPPGYRSPAARPCCRSSRGRRRVAGRPPRFRGRRVGVDGAHGR